ncbi:sugar kinase, partial [Streptomyces sp. NPDC057654]
ELVVLAGALPQTCGERLRELVAAELTGIALPEPQLRMTAVDGSPILIGALQTALAEARNTVFDTA